MSDLFIVCGLVLFWIAYFAYCAWLVFDLLDCFGFWFVSLLVDSMVCIWCWCLVCFCCSLWFI